MEELIEPAEEYIKNLLRALSDYEYMLLTFIHDVMKLAKVNENIDNTKV